MGFAGRSTVLAILPTWVVPATAACSIPSESADSAAPAEPVSGKPVVFADLNWQSALIQNRVAQYLVEKGYGYPTDVVFGATLPLFQGLRNGDVDVMLEIWLSNLPETRDAAIEAEEIALVGKILVGDWQSAFVIPAYLQEQYPGLDSVEDLKDANFKALFTTAETGGKARLVSCMIGWACESANSQQIAAYGLEGHVYIVNPGDGAAANADLYGAYERDEPWLGYQGGTNEPALVLELVRLEEPERDAALWFLQARPEIWNQWATPEAAEAIQAALDAGEAADGWPTQ